MKVISQRFLCGSLLLLGASVAGAFPVHSPLQQQQGAAAIPDSTTSSSLDMVSDSNKTTNDNNAGVGLLNAFFRGVTMPFPMLRRLAGSADGQVPKQQDYDKIGFSLKEALIAIGCYLALGVAAYSSQLIQDQPWSLVDALYFSVVTFTTVGYGDLCPTTLAGKVFTVLFGLTGISILGAAVATIGSQIVEKEVQMMQAAQQAGRRTALDFALDFWDEDGEKNKDSAAEKEAQQQEKKKPSNWMQLVLRLLRNAIPSLTLLMAGGLVMGNLEGWSWQDAVYYSFITAGTLGYGDFSPATENGRLWAVFFIPLAVGAAGEVLGGVASWMVQRRQERFYKMQLERELNMERLLEMDADKNQRVSREEYVEFMLKEMQMVDDDTFKELHAQFKKLDVDGGGYLDKNDLRLMVAKRQREQAEAAKAAAQANGK